MYIGVNVEVLEEIVVVFIEGQVNGVDDMIYMQLISNDSGNYFFNVIFVVGMDFDIVMVNVQNWVSQVISQLLLEVIQNGVIV